MDYGILIAVISIVGTLGVMLASVTAPPPSVPVVAESDREQYQKAA